MSATVTIFDETLFGERTPALRLDLISATITLRELIRRRVYEEVQEYNAATPEYFRELVQPTDAERALNGYKLRQRRRLELGAAIRPRAGILRAQRLFCAGRRPSDRAVRR